MAGQLRLGLTGVECEMAKVHILPRMPDSAEQPVMLPFQDKVGTGWHVVIRYHEGHEREITGFASEQEALEWIVANANQVDK